MCTDIETISDGLTKRTFVFFNIKIYYYLSQSFRKQR